MKFLKLFLICFSLSAMGQNERPNIIILFADDLGYSDIGCYGGEIKTPNLDKLATEGVRFTHFVNGAKCAPSRAALLTGLYAVEAGCMGPPDQIINGVTIPELLKQKGYETYMSGKWHAKEHPIKRGFDQYYGITSGAFNYFKPKAKKAFWNNETRINPAKAVENSNSFYTTDAFTNKAIDYLEASKNSDKPFFLWLSYNAPHYPLQAWPKDIAKYRGKYLKGWDAIRKERFKRQQKIGIVKPNWKLSKRDAEISAWKRYKNKDIADLTMATYAAMVDRMDQNIGKLMQKLDAIGKKDNTLIVFLSDNGGCAEGEMWNGEHKKNEPGLKNSQAKLGIEWANACNTPFKYYKRSTYNGGQVTPCIISWPKSTIKKGSITYEKANIVDLMPTFLEVADINYPEGETWKIPEEKNLKSEWKIQPLSGVSIVPFLLHHKKIERENMKGYFQTNKMLIAKDWKIVSTSKASENFNFEKKSKWKLYNLKEDGTEVNDLALQKPKLLDSLSSVFQKWQDQHQLAAKSKAILDEFKRRKLERKKRK